MHLSTGPRIKHVRSSLDERPQAERQDLNMRTRERTPPPLSPRINCTDYGDFCPALGPRPARGVVRCWPRPVAHPDSGRILAGNPLLDGQKQRYPSLPQLASTWSRLRLLD